MKKYVIEYNNGDKVDFMLSEYASFKEAMDALVSYFKDNPYFLFRIREYETEPNESITNFTEACEALGIKDKDIELKFKNYFGLCDKDIKLLEHFVKKINVKHLEALIALNALFTIAEAWNKEDGFVPDFSNRNQWKYFPLFTCNNDAAEFVYAFTSFTASAAFAHFGSRLCFKSESRARQFGKKFTHLYNKVFKFNNYE